MFGVLVIDNKEYSVSFQDAFGVTWVHAQVRNWSPAIARRLRAEFDDKFKEHGGPLFAINEPHLDKKHIKFLKAGGFRMHSEQPALDGGIRHIYVRP
jgi:hypothetical protein